jgi:epoxyqueuosine reductase
MATSKPAGDNAAWIENIIKDFIENSPENTLTGPFDEKAWDEPLVGFSNGADPIFQSYKEHVGEFHWTPAEIFAEIFPDETSKDDELTVVSWILPQTEATKADNRREVKFPAHRWARSRIFGEKTNEKLRLHVAEEITKAGYKALAATLTPNWKMMPSPKFFLASKWSERHAAHAAGLGTFGVCDGLITPKGKAVRVGSVIAKINVPPSPRPYDTHQAYCLYYSEGVCLECVKRCPVNALSANGHDKPTCLGHLRPTTVDYVKENYGFDGYGCGLCQVGVPCESKIPTLDDLE